MKLRVYTPYADEIMTIPIMNNAAIVVVFFKGSTSYENRLIGLWGGGMTGLGCLWGCVFGWARFSVPVGWSSQPFLINLCLTKFNHKLSKIN